MSKKTENPKPRRLSDQTVEEGRLEAELLREQREEADRQDRGAIRRLIKGLEQEDIEDPPN